ncbi:MAG: phosphodiester glycosidase family protein [Bacilli bacterium]|nr:phosphodiester glycosidase family protein [Bacilli bacterium]
MEREEKNESKKELEESVYSSLNIGSFLELKRRERDLNKQKESSNEPKKEVLKVTPLVKEEPKKEVITKKVVASIEEKKVEPKKDITPRDSIKKIEKETTKTPSIPKKTVEETKQDLRELLKKRKEEELKKEPVKKEKSKHEEKEEIKKEDTKSNEKTKKEIQEEPLDKKDTEKKEKTSKKKSSKREQKKKEKKSKEKPTKLGKGLIVGIVICVIMDLFACTGLFLTYGPISYFRNLLVTSAMTTMSHKYLARTFYSEKTIEKILSNNTLTEVDENTNSNDINFEDGKDTGEYSSIYEEQILKRDKDQLYKVIEIKENNYSGHLIAIYDASRVKLVGATNTNYGGAFLTDISKRNNAKVAINASGFYNGGDKGSTAVGTVIMNGKVVTTGSPSGYGGGLSGFNKDHVLVLTRDDPATAIKNGMVDAVEFGPFLIVNGKASDIKGDGGWGLASRTVLAQRKDGIVLFLVIDGRQVGHSIGIDMGGLIKILQRYNAHNAVNLDGGGSTTLVVEGKLTNRPCCSVDPTSKQRYVPNAWIVK